MNVAKYWPDAGDLVWTEFDPTVGASEQDAGRR